MLCLNHRDTHAIEQLTCIKGRMWITQAGLADDIVLQPAESYTVNRQSGPMIISPLNSSESLVAAILLHQAGKAKFLLPLARRLRP
jgi:hypothetical protein